MEAQYLQRRDVGAMIRLAIRRARRMFDGYHDIDDESLFADMFGEVSRSNYDSTKSQPHTFAYRVAWCRLRDISRRRSKEAQRRQEAIDLGEFKREEQTDSGSLEEIAIQIYTLVKFHFGRLDIPARPKFCALLYLDSIQRISLFTLQQRMGWSCREAEAVLRSNPQVLLAIGVAHAPDHTFFSRVQKGVAHLQNILASARHATTAA